MRPFKTRSTMPALAVSLCALSLAACGGSDGGKPLDLTILHINDHHSHLDAETTTLTLKDAAGASKAVSVELGGFARVTAAIEALATGKPNVLKLHAGDYLQAGSPVLALLSANEFYVIGYFEETKLPRVQPGAPVEVGAPPAAAANAAGRG